MQRRNFIKQTSALVAAGTLPAKSLIANPDESIAPLDKPNEREYWVELMYKIAYPVLSNLSKGQLRKNMPVEVGPGWDGRNKDLAYMEAFGRLMAGIAPWLTLADDATKEGRQRKELREFALQGFTNSVDANSPDYLLWNKESQPLVDAAFIAHSFLRASSVLWEPLSNETKQNYSKEFKALRRVKPSSNNWVLFAAMIETFLLAIDEQYDEERISIAINKINEWYKGDGWYGDGEHFHFDYYNSYVIQPMLVDILDVLTKKGKAKQEQYDLALKRMQRYSDFLERLVSPEATYPAFGRSITYRVAVFQPLSQLVLIDKLPVHITASQVRSLLTAVMKRMFKQPGVFTKDNWLQLGFAGHQPSVADYYSNTGSMYLTSVAFLPLGLPPDHLFWSGPFTEWSSRLAWSGRPFNKDYAVDY
ncbi:MAG: DUF2264 domain-containing protein [Bacteroidetes bacterium]|nr:DUF2264 domain-containing protein [Bacteroidota bacterium]